MDDVSKHERTVLDSASLAFFLNKRPTLATRILNHCVNMDFYKCEYDDMLDLYALVRAMRNYNVGWNPAYLMPYDMLPDEDNQNSEIGIMTEPWCGKTVYVNSMYRGYSPMEGGSDCTEVKFYSKLYGPGIDWHVSIVFTFDATREYVEKIIVKHAEHEYYEHVPVYVYAHGDELRLTHVSGDVWLDIDVVGLFKEIGCGSGVVNINADGCGDDDLILPYFEVESRTVGKDVVTIFNKTYLRTI